MPLKNFYLRLVLLYSHYRLNYGYVIYYTKFYCKYLMYLGLKFLVASQEERLRL